MTKVAILLLLRLLPTTISQQIPQRTAAFGEECGTNGFQCDSQALTTCIDNLCKCFKPEEMAFDNEKKNVVVLLGKRTSVSRTNHWKKDN